MLLQLPYAVSRSPRQIVIADDCLQKVKIPVDRIAQVVIKSTEKLFGSKLFSLHLDTCSMILVQGGQVHHCYHFSVLPSCTSVTAITIAVIIRVCENLQKVNLLEEIHCKRKW